MSERMFERETGKVIICWQTETGKMTGQLRADSDGRTVDLYPQRDKKSLRLKMGEKVSYQRWYCGDTATATRWQVENGAVVPKEEMVSKTTSGPKKRDRLLQSAGGRSRRRP